MQIRYMSWKLDNDQVVVLGGAIEDTILVASVRIPILDCPVETMARYEEENTFLTTEQINSDPFLSSFKFAIVAKLQAEAHKIINVVNALDEMVGTPLPFIEV